jgi:hypothetical protein
VANSPPVSLDKMTQSISFEVVADELAEMKRQPLWESAK